jgi:hypothetical protein
MDTPSRTGGEVEGLPRRISVATQHGLFPTAPGGREQYRYSLCFCQLWPDRSHPEKPLAKAGPGLLLPHPR